MNDRHRLKMWEVMFDADARPSADLRLLEAPTIEPLTLWFRRSQSRSPVALETTEREPLLTPEDARLLAEEDAVRFSK